MSIWDRILNHGGNRPPEADEQASPAIKDDDRPVSAQKSGIDEKIPDILLGVPGIASALREIEDECMDQVQALDSKEKRIVVFISSTFRDMVAERDELTLRVFPELRKICEERGIAWGEVDLRWGIPPEKEREEILETCLRFIDTCRPYFIGMLGERYGWTGWQHSPDLVSEMPWLGQAQGRSVTELEVLHGVLKDPGMQSRAFFYFRDPTYIQTLPEKERQDYLELPTDEERKNFGDVEAERLAVDRRQRLADLKAGIRDSGMPVYENYKDPIALGQLVRADLLAVIDELVPLEPATVTDEKRETTALDRETAAHDAFARSRFGVYVPRQSYFEALDDHAAADGPPLAVTGESGTGKSALLAHWTDWYKVRHPDAVVIRHFVGATSDSVDLTAMLRRFMGEFRRQLGVQGEIPMDDAALRAAFLNWLSMAAAKGRIVLVIDALNQLEDRHGALDLTWLPPVVPANVRLIVSSLEGQPLDAVTKRGWPALNVGRLTIDERKILIRCYLRRFCHELSPALEEQIAAAEQTANPLFLRALLEELRVHGTFEELSDQISGYLAIPTIPRLYEDILARYERDYERDRPGLVRDLCQLVWASRRGLSRDELRDLLGDSGPLPDAHWAPLLLAMQSGLVEKGDVLTFFHEYLRTAVEARYISDDAADTAMHLELAEYFEGSRGGPRRLEELPWQLARAGAWDKLTALLTEPVVCSALYEMREYDLKHYWVNIEAESPHRMVVAYEPAIREPSRFPSAFLRNLWGLLHDTGHLVAASALGEHLIQSAKDSGDSDALQASLGNQALILWARGDLVDAMALLNEKEQICRAIGNIDGLQRSLVDEANILADRGHLDDAMALYKEAEQICREIGKVDGLQRSLGDQALILRAYGDLDGAMALLKEQERICRDLGNIDGLQRSLGNQALIHIAHGDLDNAMVLLKEQERICRELGNLDGLQASLGNRANILAGRGHQNGAMALYKEVEQICREIGNADGLLKSLGNQAIILASLGRRAEASHAADEALVLAERGDYAPLAAQIRDFKERFGL